jgi:pimeloyl-ACP methyl ester carboxylesterase
VLDGRLRRAAPGGGTARASRTRARRHEGGDTPEAAQNRVRLAETIREHGVDAPQDTAKWLRAAALAAAERLIRAQDKEAVAQASVGGRRFDRRLAGSTPTAVIVGEADAIRPAQSRAMATRYPCDASVIPDAGHLANLEAPEAFGARCVHGFAS